MAFEIGIDELLLYKVYFFSIKASITCYIKMAFEIGIDELSLYKNYFFPSKLQ